VTAVTITPAPASKAKAVTTGIPCLIFGPPLVSTQAGTLGVPCIPEVPAIDSAQTSRYQYSAREHGRRIGDVRELAARVRSSNRGTKLAGGAALARQAVLSCGFHR
jgi:hypothetical protein